MPPRPRRTVQELSEELFFAWEHIDVLINMQLRLLEQLYPNRHDPEHADHAQCTYILMLEQQLAVYRERMAERYVVHDDDEPAP